MNAAVPSVVALAGDWHGNIPWAQQSIAYLGRLGIGTCYHVGDFGIWPGRTGKRWLQSVESAAAMHNVSIVVTPGNHEDWARLDARWVTTPGEPLQLTPHASVLPRGYRWTHGGRSFVSFGGAASIDFESRTQGKTWWPAEIPTEEDVAAVIVGGYADVMITHDAPQPGTPVVQAARTQSDGRWSRAALAYAAASAERITKAYEGVAPRVLVHGHYHARDEATSADGRKLISLGADTQPGNLVLLDLSDLSHSWATPGSKQSRDTD